MDDLSRAVIVVVVSVLILAPTAALVWLVHRATARFWDPRRTGLALMLLGAFLLGIWADRSVSADGVDPLNFLTAANLIFGGWYLRRQHRRRNRGLTQTAHG